MSISFLFLRPVAAGLVSAALLIGCSESESGGACSGDGCEESRSASSDDDDERPSKDAGKRDAGAKDGGSTKSDAGNKGSSQPDTSSDGTGSGGSDVPCEVAKILAARCGTCHGEEPSFGAPSSLVSAADFQATSTAGGKMLAAVKTRIGESDPRKAMPPASSAPLTEDERATLDAWLAAGATAGEGCATAPDRGGEETPTAPPIDDADLTCYKLLAHAGDGKTPYKVGVAKDAYFNFTFKAPWQGMVYGITFKPVIDNKQVIHHWLLFQDDKPGAPSGAVRSIGAHPGGQLLTGWAPGGEDVDFRQSGADVGIELPGNTTYTVEYHYNSNDASAKDASGVEICVHTKKPANIAGLSWLGVDKLLVPATKWTGVCRPAAQKPINIVFVSPHMHKTGTHMKATINRAGGAKEILHDLPFDFNYQRGYNKKVTLMPGDTVTTECTFNKPMTFGESTNAEMCYLFTMAYPKGALADLGVWGAIAHGGSSCLGQ